MIEPVIPFLDAGPMARIDAHQFHLETLGPAIVVPTRVRRFASPNVMWLNARWFAEQGLDLGDVALRRVVETAFIERFAVETVGPDDSSVLSGYFADRYGLTGGTTFGGSGRCVTSGGFIVKGIGPTDLVSPSADWYHSHGFMWHEEAIREAIASEIAAAEMPGGGAAIVAIIDTGTALVHDDGTFGARRALTVRAGFARLAHLERSVFFGSAGTASSDQAQDATRVRDAVHHVFGDHPAPEARLLEIIDRAAQHVAFTLASRLWSGGFLSSNVSLDGALVDFGGFRSVPDWRPVIGDPKLPAFGCDFTSLRATAHSLAYQFGKHLRRDPRLEVLLAAIERREGDLFADMAFSAADPESVRPLCGMLMERFRSEQAGLPSHADEGGVADAAGAERIVCGTVGRTTSSLDPALECRAQRHLSPRPLLDRERLLAMTVDFLSGAAIGPDEIAGFIGSVVGRSRRIWRRLPDDLIVRAQLSRPTWTCLYCSSGNGTVDTIWCEAQLCVDEAVIAGQVFKIDDLRRSHDLVTENGWCSFVAPAGYDDRGVPGLVANGRFVPLLFEVAYAY